MPNIPRYLISTDHDQTVNLREAVALLEGVEPLWCAEMFSLLVVDIASDESRSVVSELADIDGFKEVVAEHVGDDNQMPIIDHPADFHVDPQFDVREENRRIMEEEIDAVTTTVTSPICDNVEIEEFADQTIAVVDTGIDIRNPQITNVTARINFTDDEDYDSIGHGTFMGCILNVQRPNINLVDMKVIGDGVIRESHVIKALEPARGIDAVSMSLGFTPRDGYCPLCEAVNRTVHAGVPVVVSAGNPARPVSNPVPPACPARAEKARAVTADSNIKSNDWFAEGEYTANVDTQGISRWNDAQLDRVSA
jgi:hypothetical protein